MASLPQGPRSEAGTGARSPVPAILACGKYAALPQVLVRRFHKQLRYRDWLKRELSEGQYLHRYLQRDKAQAVDRWRAVALASAGFRPNAKHQDGREIARVPVRDFLRWRKTDPDFWKDDANLKKLAKEDPAIRACIHL